jgi:hypothetical protein
MTDSMDDKEYLDSIEALNKAHSLIMGVANSGSGSVRDRLLSLGERLDGVIEDIETVG